MQLRMEGRSLCRQPSVTVSGNQLFSQRLQRFRCSYRARFTVASQQPNGLETRRAGEVVRYGKGLLIPSQLLGTPNCKDGSRQQTVYTLRFSTGYTRGSGLEEPLAGVQVCMVGEDGSALLHRVAPFFDPEALQRELDAISQVVDESVGANRNAIAKASSRVQSVPPGKRRFQAGGVDEISFLGPELGPLISLMVAPEDGSWRLEEVTVSSSRSRHTDRFVCGELLGTTGGVGFLAAVPTDAVVYGSGESVVILTRAQAKALHDAGMGKYSLFKQRLLQANMSLVSLGTGLAWTLAGDDTAISFAMGGAGGLLYQWLLQKGIDGIPAASSTLSSQAGGYATGEAIQKLLASGPFRVGLVGAMVFAAIASMGQEPLQVLAPYHPNQVQQMMIGVAGFLCYKLAIVGVMTLPPLFPQRN